MSLPKIAVPKFVCVLPSSGKEVTFRPFLVKEEKALLIAVESKDQESIIRAIKEAISACVDEIDVSKLPYFDIEFLFLNLRSKSVGENVTFTYKHKNGVNREGKPCDKTTNIELSLDEVKVQRDPKHVDKFMIDSKYGVKMKYPTIDDIKALASQVRNEIKLMASCLEYVYDETNIYPPDSLDEAVKYIENMNAQQYEKLTHFFETMPKLAHDIHYKCAGCGQEDVVKLEGVSDFF